jgi:hypothetical protein
MILKDLRVGALRKLTVEASTPDQYREGLATWPHKHVLIDCLQLRPFWSKSQYVAKQADIGRIDHL